MYPSIMLWCCFFARLDTGVLVCSCHHTAGGSSLPPSSELYTALVCIKQGGCVGRMLVGVCRLRHPHITGRSRTGDAGLEAGCGCVRREQQHGVAVGEQDVV